MIDVTREELRADIEEIVGRIVHAVVTEEKRSLIHMINEDLYATNQRIDRLDRKMTRRFSKLENALRSHASDPNAHQNV
jgi:hypothetical protein